MGSCQAAAFAAVSAAASVVSRCVFWYIGFMIDLHTHSSASDGILLPEEFALYVAEKNLSVWALTDHDTVDGLKAAAKTCLKTGVIFVPGIEINIAWPCGEFHLLGLGLRRKSEELKNVIEYLTEERNRRNSEIVRKMNEDGYNFTLEEIRSCFSASQIGRPHFADFLVKKGIVKNRQEAFDRFLSRGKRWYVTHTGENLETAVEAIKSSGGVPVIAHPLSLYLGMSSLEEELKKVRNAGVMGLEAWHPAARKGQCRHLEEIAEKLGMFVTAGSDFHGKGVRADRHLGRTADDKKIEDRFWLEGLKPALGEDFDFKTTDWVKD